MLWVELLWCKLWCNRQILISKLKFWSEIGCTLHLKRLSVCFLRGFVTCNIRSQPWSSRVLFIVIKFVDHGDAYIRGLQWCKRNHYYEPWRNRFLFLAKGSFQTKVTWSLKYQRRQCLAKFSRLWNSSSEIKKKKKKYHVSCFDYCDIKLEPVIQAV